MTREKAIRVLESSDMFWIRPTEDEEEAITMAIEALKALMWNPCETEGMPPEGEEVLVSDGNYIWTDESVAGDATDEGYMKWWDSGADWADTAWMPLPEPYEGGEEG